MALSMARSDASTKPSSIAGRPSAAISWPIAPATGEERRHEEGADRRPEQRTAGGGQRDADLSRIGAPARRRSRQLSPDGIGGWDIEALPWLLAGAGRAAVAGLVGLPRPGPEPPPTGAGI